MKISFSTLSCPQWSWTKVIDEASRMGYDGIEVRGIQDELYLPNLKPFMSENLDNTLKDLKERGLEICCLDTSCIFHDDNIFDASLKEGIATINLAKYMGIPYIRVFGDRIPDVGKKDETIKQVAKGIEQLGRYAEDKGVIVLQETHGAFSNSDYLLEVLDKASSPAIGVIWDIANPFEENNESIYETYRKLSKYIKHTHIKDIKVSDKSIQVHMPGKGDLPIEDIISLLKGNGYNGWLSFEWEKRWHHDIEDPEIVLPYFIEYIKKFL